MSRLENAPERVQQAFNEDLTKVETLAGMTAPGGGDRDILFAHWVLSGRADRFIDDDTWEWRDA